MQAKINATNIPIRRDENDCICVLFVYSVYISNTDAQNITGNPDKNEISMAALLERPIYIPPKITEADLETPG